MKKKLAGIIFFLNIFTVFAQENIYGVYSSWHDYSTGKLTYLISCNSAKDKIRLHDSFSGRYVDVIKGGSRTRLCKDSIFGYTDCSHNTYRFYKSYDKEYRIEENKGVVIYTAYLTAYTSNGRPYMVKAYFFSVHLNSPVLPLTVRNLEKAIPGNLKFHDMLDITFGDGTPVAEYDTEHNMYKINFLLNRSLNK